MIRVVVTVGAQMPFDRLVRLVDEWAASNPDTDILAQIGNSGYQPRSLRSVRTLRPSELRAAMQRATGIVCHAGMGTILTALELGRPIVVFPRLASLRETRHDHQVATACTLAREGMVRVAYSREELFEQLSAFRRPMEAKAISSGAPQEILAAIRAFALADDRREQGKQRTFQWLWRRRRSGAGAERRSR